jgi:hypothetical protein
VAVGATAPATTKPPALVGDRCRSDPASGSSELGRLRGPRSWVGACSATSMEVCCFDKNEERHGQKNPSLDNSAPHRRRSTRAGLPDAARPRARRDRRATLAATQGNLGASRRTRSPSATAPRPPRTEAIDAVAEAREAGITTVMIPATIQRPHVRSRGSWASCRATTPRLTASMRGRRPRTSCGSFANGRRGGRDDGRPRERRTGAA